MNILESKIESYLVQEVTKHGGKCLKWVCPQHNGVPDRIVFLDSKVRFVELKSPTGKLSALQMMFHNWLRKHKYSVTTISTKDEVDSFIKSVLSGAD